MCENMNAPSFWSAYQTWYSQAIPHPSTNKVRPYLALEIRQDLPFLGWYGRKKNFRNMDVLDEIMSNHFFGWRDLTKHRNATKTTSDLTFNAEMMSHQQASK